MFLTICIVGVFVLLLWGLWFLKKQNISFNVRTILALVVGIIFGIVLQFAVKDKTVVSKSLAWISIVGSGYVRLLYMIVFPLIFISIAKSIATQKSNMGKAAVRILAVLMITVAISALLSAFITAGVGLTAEGLQQGSAEIARGTAMNEKLAQFETKPIQQQIIEIIPTNPFAALTGVGSNPTLSTVFFAAMIGFSVFFLKRTNEKSANMMIDIITATADTVMRLVMMILRLTPYGVMALMTATAATSNFDAVVRLGQFIAVSYAAIILMFIVHGLYLLIHGLNPFVFFKKSFSTLLFAFTSRSSAGTLPMTISNMEKNLGVSEGIANLAGSLGISIGQNGCAGIYPAMLAVMIAPVVGINPLAPAFLVKLVLITAFSSFGIVGVGGGATFAALVVLSTLGFPVELAGLLIAIEPIIDMGRTALNVSDSMLAGVIAAKKGQELDETVYYAKEVNNQ